MSVKIRLKRMGAIKRPFYRIVVADSRMPRDGRFIETLGYYNPCIEPSELKLDADRVKLWLSRGAQPTDTAGGLLKREGLMERGKARSQSGSKTVSAPAAGEELVQAGE